MGRQVATNQAVAGYQAGYNPWVREQLQSQGYDFSPEGQISGFQGNWGALPPGLSEADVTAGIDRLTQEYMTNQGGALDARLGGWAAEQGNAVYNDITQPRQAAQQAGAYSNAVEQYEAIGAQQAAQYHPPAPEPNNWLGIPRPLDMARSAWDAVRSVDNPVATLAGQPQQTPQGFLDTVTDPYPGGRALRDAISDKLGDLGALYDSYAGQAQTPLGRASGGPSAESVGRFIGTTTPTTWTELAASPLIGFLPGVDDAAKAAARRLAPVAARAGIGLADNVAGYGVRAAGLGDAVVPTGAAQRAIAPATPLTNTAMPNPNALYHGGPEIADNVLRRGQRGSGDAGGIFLTPNREYAERYAGATGRVYEADVPAGARLFDPKSPADIQSLRQGFLSLVGDEYESAADALADFAQVSRLDLSDWATGSQWTDAIKAAGFDGARLTERTGIESIAMFADELPVRREAASQLPTMPRVVSPTEGEGLLPTGGGEPRPKDIPQPASVAPAAQAADVPSPAAASPPVGSGAATPPAAAAGDGDANLTDWEYSLKKLQEAREQGPEAFTAMKARLANVAEVREAERQAALKANASLNFSTTAKAEQAATREQMAAAMKQAEEAARGPGYHAGIPVKMPENGEEWVRSFVNEGPQRLGNELRQATAGLDLSNALRQGWGTIRHGADYLSDIKTMARGLVDEDFALRTNAALREGNGAKSGLFIADLPGEGPAVIAKREENYAGSLIGDLPGFKQSGRANTLFLNKRRDSIFNIVESAWQRSAEAIGEGTAGPWQRVQGKLARPGDMEALANYINRTTGRGTLGSLEKTWVSDLLGIGLFSPRYQASRVQGPLQMFNVAHPLVAIEAMKDYAVSFAATVSVLALANESGLASINMDPRSSDFGKLKVGNNTRIDPWAGYQQLATLTARLLSGEYEGGFDADAGDLLTRFVRGKLSPLAGRSLDVASGKDFMGREYGVKELPASLLPIFAQGLHEAAKDGLLGEAAMTLPASFFGLGTNTYPETVSRRQDRLAKEEFGKDFDSLDIAQQAEMNAQMAAKGIPIGEWDRARPYFGADDKAFNQLKQANAALAEYDTLNDFRDALTERLSGRGLLPQEVDATRAKIEKELGLTTQLVQAEKLRVIAKDPGIVDALQKLYEDGKLQYPPAKYLREFVEGMKKLQEVR